jgi:hypothetical protein
MSEIRAFVETVNELMHPDESAGKDRGTGIDLYQLPKKTCVITSLSGNFFRIGASTIKKGRGCEFAASFIGSGAKSGLTKDAYRAGLARAMAWECSALDSVTKTFGIVKQVNPTAS